MIFLLRSGLLSYRNPFNRELVIINVVILYLVALALSTDMVILGTVEMKGNIQY